MTDIIKVPYLELLQRAGRIRQEADTIRAEIKTLKEAVENVQWIGKRADRFFSAWQEAIPDMENWVSALESFALELEEQARRMQSVDEVF